MYPSASEILTAFTKNPDEGGKLLFERYYKPLVLFADSFLTDIHFSEDIVQDVFYDFIKHRSYRQIAPEALHHLSVPVYTEYLPEPSAQSQACYGSRIVEIRSCRRGSDDYIARTDRCNPGNDQTIT